MAGAIYCASLWPLFEGGDDHILSHSAGSRLRHQPPRLLVLRLRRFPSPLVQSSASFQLGNRKEYLRSRAGSRVFHAPARVGFVVPRQLPLWGEREMRLRVFRQTVCGPRHIFPQPHHFESGEKKKSPRAINFPPKWHLELSIRRSKAFMDQHTHTKEAPCPVDGRPSSRTPGRAMKQRKLQPSVAA